ncbi:hypothetical protein pdam_00021358 [Pocillopora damicornis]|uniref:Uncharacterized protein n=1 Tax=Pocillopora damicornis TaxID=46731 RepID=A0A3M6UNQ5_POCDA|nr:hypothetical protein pdam_00021358 [Pocillopora damicornis]
MPVRLFFKFTKPQDKLPSTQRASVEKEANCNNSKRNKHFSYPKKSSGEEGNKFNGSAKVIKVGVANEDVTLEILTVKGPYTTAHRVYTSFSSHCLPNVNLVQKSRQDLAAAGLGIFKVINKLKIFL